NPPSDQSVVIPVQVTVAGMTSQIGEFTYIPPVDCAAYQAREQSCQNCDPTDNPPCNERTDASRGVHINFLDVLHELVGILGRDRGLRSGQLAKRQRAGRERIGPLAAAQPVQKVFAILADPPMFGGITAGVIARRRLTNFCASSRRPKWARHEAIKR